MPPTTRPKGFWGSPHADEGQWAFLHSYGRTMPAWMLPEHHPDYRPVPKVVQSKPRPKDKAFDWRSTVKPWTLAGHAARLKGHPQAKTWKGNYPDAPPSGQEGPRLPTWEADPTYLVTYPSEWDKDGVYHPRPWGSIQAGGKRVRHQGTRMAA